MKNFHGFTTIELVTVIIIVGILAVNVLPRFDGTASYEAHTHRAQLISALRLTQQRAMQQTSSGDSYCHQIVFDNDSVPVRYGVPDRTDCGITVFPNNWQPDATGHILDDRYDITYSIDSSALNQVSFDWLGRANNCDSDVDNGSDAKLGCTILVESAVQNGADALKITIESEGYIHGTF